jgi:ABC-type multidrug transport system ATPase subunit
VHAEERKTVLMVEHHIEVVTGLADRIAVMHHGRLIACDTPVGVRAALGRGVVEVACHPPARALDLLVGQPWVRSANLVGTRLHVLLADGAGHGALRAHLVAGGVAVVSIATAEPSLEDAFVTLTAA